MADGTNTPDAASYFVPVDPADDTQCDSCQ